MSCIKDAASASVISKWNLFRRLARGVPLLKQGSPDWLIISTAAIIPSATVLACQHQRISVSRLATLMLATLMLEKFAPCYKPILPMRYSLWRETWNSEQKVPGSWQVPGSWHLGLQWHSSSKQTQIASASHIGHFVAVYPHLDLSFLWWRLATVMSEKFQTHDFRNSFRNISCWGKIAVSTEGNWAATSFLLPEYAKNCPQTAKLLWPHAII